MIVPGSIVRVALFFTYTNPEIWYFAWAYHLVSVVMSPDTVITWPV